MQAAITDFVGGLVRECHDLADPWRWRQPAGEEQGLARLCCWGRLARSLPPLLDSPHGPQIPVTSSEIRAMVADCRGLHHTIKSRPHDAEALVVLIEQFYHLVAHHSDPPQAFVSDQHRAALSAWAQTHGSATTDWARAAVAMLDFVRLSPLAAHNAQVGAILAAALPFWAGQPLIHALDVDTRGEDGFSHALGCGLDDDPGAWIAYVLAKQRRTLKRLPGLLENAIRLRDKWVRLFRRAPFGPESALSLAWEMTLMPVISQRFLNETGLSPDFLRDAMVLLFAADEASEVTLANGDMLTILPAALHLLTPAQTGSIKILR